MLNNVELEGRGESDVEKSKEMEKLKAGKEEKVDIEQYPANIETKRRVSGMGHNLMKKETIVLEIRYHIRMYEKEMEVCVGKVGPMQNKTKQLIEFTELKSYVLQNSGTSKQSSLKYSLIRQISQ